MPYYIKRKKKEPSKWEGFPTTKKAVVKKKVNLVAKLDKVFSQYIRLRDTMPNKFFVCISCGQIKPFDQCDCGHYFSRAHMATRFYEDNAHGECRHCNRFRADHLVGYQISLIRKIGQQRYDKLCWLHSQTRKWSDFELQQMIEYYKKEVYRLSKDKGIKVN